MKYSLFIVLFSLFSLNNAIGNYIITDVNYIGLHRTRFETLDKVLNLKGQSVAATDSFELFKQAEKDLYNTKLFAKVRHTSKVENETISLTFYVKERWYTYAIPYFDIIDRNFNEWRVTRNHDLSRVIFGADVTQKNTTGRNDDLSLSVLLGNQTRLNLKYELPNYFKDGKLGLGFNIQYHSYRNVNYDNFANQLVFYRDDEVLLKRWLSELRLSYHLGFNKEIWFNVGLQNENVHSIILNLNPLYNGQDGLKNLSFAYSTLGIRLDSRDIRGYAQKGQLLKAELAFFGFKKSQNLNYWELNARYTRHIPFIKRADLALSSIAKMSSNKLRPYYLNRGIGWATNTIRCYDYYVIDGNSFFIQKASFRYRAINKDFKFNWLPWKALQYIPFKAAPKVFFDVGYVNSSYYPNRGNLVNQPLYSYGLGVDLIVFDDAVWRIEYGKNQLGEASIFLNFTSAIQ